MIYPETPEAIEKHCKAFIRKWRLKHEAAASSLEEAGDRLFTFTRLPPSQWRSARTTNAIERLHEEFKRRIKTQTVLPSADTAAMLFWALLASGQTNMRKVDGWKTLATKPIDQQFDFAALIWYNNLSEIIPLLIPTTFRTGPTGPLHRRYRNPPQRAGHFDPAHRDRLRHASTQGHRLQPSVGVNRRLHPGPALVPPLGGRDGRSLQ
jgi:hypothetical protein